MRLVLTLAMLLTACAHSRAARPARPHPLDPLGSEEYARAYAALDAHFAADPSLPKDHLRHPLLGLAEPPKAAQLAWREGQPFARHAEAHVLHNPSARAWVARIDLAQAKVVALRELPKGVQPAVAGSEFQEAHELVRTFEPWRAALRLRGLDPDRVYVDLWAPGQFALPSDVVLSHGPHTRLMRALAFDLGTQHPSNAYDRPVEGLVATIDLNAMKVVHLHDSGVRPVSQDSGNADGMLRVKPLRTTQPEGSDILLDGRRVRWHGYTFVLGFHPRDGLVLYDVRHDDRPIAYRLALSEIYVPYGLGDPAWSMRSAFDVGEYNAGTSAQPLQRGADVPAHAQLFDQQVNRKRVVQGAIGLYERDAGVLWTRTDPMHEGRDIRRARELVVTWNTVIGNYIYAFDWVFKLDGSLEVVTTLHGTTLNRGTTDAPEASAPKIAKDARGTFTAAPHHQHFISFRLDLDVDGPDNTLMEMDVVPAHDATYKNAFDTTMLHFHEEAARDLEPRSARHWHVESGHARNALGKPTSYALEPGAFAVPYSAPDFHGLERAGFATHQVWLTRQRDDERYAAGDFPYQTAEPDGVSKYANAEPLTPSDDVVLWYTTGFTHVARPEDHPVMPGESVSFRLMPRGFFARNPGLALEPAQ